MPAERSELTPKGEAETLAAVRRWFDAWSNARHFMSRDEAAHLPEWEGMVEALGYDRDARAVRRSPTTRGTNG